METFVNPFKRTQENPRLLVRELFAKYEDPDEAALLWSKSVAARSGLSPERDQVRLIRELRKADPSLDLATARFMAKEAANH